MGSYLFYEVKDNEQESEQSQKTNAIFNLFTCENDENEENDNKQKNNNNNNNNNKNNKSWLKTIRIERGVVEHFLGYQGCIQYYKLGNWLNHGSVIVRKEEGNNKIAAKCHLIFTNNGWIVKIELTEWKPNKIYILLQIQNIHGI